MKQNTFDTLRDLVPFVPSKERCKHLWRSVITKSNTAP